MKFWMRATRMGVVHGEGRSGGYEGKIGWKLSKLNTRAVSRGQNELIDKFKLVVGDLISIMG